MKKLMSIIVTFLAAAFSVSVNAQATQMATLLHEGQVSVFYGPNSLVDSYTAAADGDVITLSAGQFNAASEIKKNLTIRGAGLDLENFKTGNIATIINGTTKVTSTNIRLEGLKFAGEFRFGSIDELYAEKCDFYKYSFYSTSTITPKHTMINCVVRDINMWGTSLSAVNCVFYDNPCANVSPSFKNGTYLNCYIADYGTLYGTFQNCIFNNSSNYSLSLGAENSMTHNCIFVGKNGGKSFGKVHATDLVRQDIETPFKEGTFHELLDEFKSFTTSDGTEPGIYGGNVGFTQTPNIPQVKSFRVAPRTSADGKLSVEIEVQGIE